MRILGALVIAIASGCGNSGPSSWTLVLEDAQLGAVTPEGQPWCPQGRPPDLHTVFEVAGVKISSSTVPSTLAPRWHEPIVSADERSLENGMSLEVVGNCGQADFTIDATAVPLARDSIEGGALALPPFGSIQRLHLQFVPVNDSGGGDPGSYDTGYYGPGNGDTGYYDPGYYDPGYYDDGTDGSDGTDDGGGDSGGDSACARHPRLHKSTATSPRRSP